ncbi:MAG: hypothetical protein AAF902_08615 [Chloroflexota bacterium]
MTINTRSNSPTPRPDLEPQQRISPRAIWISVITVSVLIIALIGFVIWMAFAFPDRVEAMRDVFIMLFALVSCSAVVVMMMMLVAMIRLINMIDYELRPILEKTNETISMVQGTTNFVSKNVIQPAIETTSFIAGVRRGIKTLFGDPRKNLPD